MLIIQKARGRSIAVSGGTKVTVNGRELPPNEAAKILVEATTKIRKGLRSANPSPAKGDVVVVMNSLNKK
jgi:hypothetical protein